MKNTLTAQEAIEREELAERIASTFMAGFIPTSNEVQRARALGLDPLAIKEAVDACYTEEDNL